MTSSAVLRDAALEAAAAGWPVFPCRLDKRPLVAGGFKTASTDPAAVAVMWREHPDASIGAAVPESLAVLDVDGEVGEATLRELEVSCDSLPATLTCRTGGGGRHLFFLHPGAELRQGAGILGRGLDTRMPRRGYVILPPSPHPSGRRYAWVDVEVPAATMPGWLVALLRPPPPPRRSVPVVRSRIPDTYIRAALEGEVANVMGAPNGTRNRTIHTAAVKLGGLVAAGLLAEYDVVEVLLDAAHASGYVASDGERQTLATIRSGLRFGERHPREVRR